MRHEASIMRAAMCATDVVDGERAFEKLNTIIDLCESDGDSYYKAFGEALTVFRHYW